MLHHSVLCVSPVKSNLPSLACRSGTIINLLAVLEADSPCPPHCPSESLTQSEMKSMDFNKKELKNHLSLVLVLQISQKNLVSATSIP